MSRKTAFGNSASTRRARSGSAAELKHDRVKVDGPWIAMPLDFLASRACAMLSPHAAKMLLLLISQLRPNGGGNGRLDASADRLRAQGWTSRATATGALRELEDANLIVLTRRGAKGWLAFYAVTLHPMNCKHDDLEVGPGAWSVSDWRRADVARAPMSVDSPAAWSRPRKDEKRGLTPRCGSATAACAPAAGQHAGAEAASGPAAGRQTRSDCPDADPPRDTPSRDAICSSPFRQANAASRRARALKAVNIGDGDVRAVDPA